MPCKIVELFALLKETKYLQHLIYKVVTTTSNWMKSQSPGVLTQQFEFLILPFGLSHGREVFIHLIYDLLGLDKTSNKHQGSGYLAYLVDTLFYSKTEKECLEMLNSAFECIHKAGLKI